MVRSNKKGSIPEALKQERRKQEASALVNVGEVVHRLRKEKQLSGVDFCRQAGGLDPKTLNALEKGRIQNPSMATLRLLARGFGFSLSDFVRQMDSQSETYFHLGGQKGTYQVEFPAWGARLISFTPLAKEFFCGKLILGGKKKLDQSFFRHRHPIYISVLVGRLEGRAENRKFSIKEGENVFLSGFLEYEIQNSLNRDSVFLIVSAPSFL